MATVIKATSGSQAGSAAAFNFDDLAGRAKDYLDQVRASAAEIVARAEQEAVAIRREAQERGMEAAVAAAHRLLDEKVAQRMATIAPAMRQAVEAIHTAKAEWLTHWEQTALHVATQIAGRVIRREVERKPQIALTLVREALELAAGCGDIQLRLHPEDVGAMGPAINSMVGELSRLGRAEIVIDPEIEKGGCRIDTRFGTIDQQFACQLERIEQELT